MLLDERVARFLLFVSLLVVCVVQREEVVSN